MSKMTFSLVFGVLVALHMGSNPVEASYDGEVLFDSSNLEYELEMPDSCKGKSYCFEQGDNYPKEKIEELLADMSELKVEDPERQTDTDFRNGDYGEADCASDSSDNPIYYIIDKKDNVRVVVQSPKFQQIYSAKWCRDEGRITKDTPHFLQSSNILQKFKIECVTSKMDFNFFVLSDEVDPASQKPKMEVASAKGGIPVCCKCRYNVED